MMSFFMIHLNNMLLIFREIQIYKETMAKKREQLNTTQLKIGVEKQAIYLLFFRVSFLTR